MRETRVKPGVIRRRKEKTADRRNRFVRFRARHPFLSDAARNAAIVGGVVAPIALSARRDIRPLAKLVKQVGKEAGGFKGVTVGEAVRNFALVGRGATPTRRTILSRVKGAIAKVGPDKLRAATSAFDEKRFARKRGLAYGLGISGGTVAVGGPLERYGWERRQRKKAARRVYEIPVVSRKTGKTRVIYGVKE